MLTAIHILLSYACNYECDHCFLYCGPHSKGTFTIGQVREVLRQAADVGTIDQIYFEGGEPFQFYAVMLEGIRTAREMDFKAGIVTNAYWATSVEDAELWLRPFRELGLSKLSISDDSLHHGEGEETPAKRALAAAEKLGIAAGALCTEKPAVRIGEKGQPEVTGGVMFKGRAVDKLTEGLPRRPWRELTTCPHEDLANPSRVHVDAYGNVHVCQGLCIGNVWRTPLAALFESYDAKAHPICGPLVAGGPARLAEEYDVEHDETYVDECHFCYVVRLALIDRFPEHLTPRQVYGLE
ncbi:MAG TPA: radical SAM protein [Planctomycetota bacterium]|nr:radical SAM protein [Planctomycetota bacterium]